MKKLTLILLMITLLMITGCKDNKKNLYLPEATNDKIYTTIGGEEEKETQTEREFCLISENTIIELNSDMANISMKPTSVEHGSGDGFKWTDNKYEDVEIRAMISDDNESIISKISTESAAYETTRGIKVGDNTKKLKDLYKALVEISRLQGKNYVAIEDGISGLRMANEAISRCSLEDVPAGAWRS